MNIIAVIGLVLSCVIGVWKYFSRKNAEKRRLADEARKKLDAAKENDSESDFLDAFDNINRV